MQCSNVNKAMQKLSKIGLPGETKVKAQDRLQKVMDRLKCLLTLDKVVLDVAIDTRLSALFCEVVDAGFNSVWSMLHRF